MNYLPAVNNTDESEYSFQSQNDLAYWNQFYNNTNDVAIRVEPSQFAAFCLTEMKDLGLNCVIELGAGNGRDAIFFANHGLKVIAMDNSQRAIHSISNKVNQQHNIYLFEHDVRNKLPDLDLKATDRSAIYARFFVHALDEITLEKFFKNTSLALKHGDFMFLEYRNEDDISKPKLTETHYRAFYSSDRIAKHAKSNNFDLVYEVSGRGFAKLKHDDAVVTRQIFHFKG